MANFVNFNKLSESKYKELEVKDAGTFYLTENNLYLGDMLLTSAIATSENLGIVKPDNESIHIDSKGKLHIIWEDIPKPVIPRKPFNEASLKEIVQMVKAADRGELNLINDCGWEIGQEKQLILPEVKPVTYEENYSYTETQPEQEITLVLMDTGENIVKDPDLTLVKPIKDSSNNNINVPHFVVGCKHILQEQGPITVRNNTTRASSPNPYIHSARRIWCNSNLVSSMMYTKDKDSNDTINLMDIFKEFNIFLKTPSGSENEYELTKNYFSLFSKGNVILSETENNFTHMVELLHKPFEYLQYNNINIDSAGNNNTMWLNSTFIQTGASVSDNQSICINAQSQLGISVCTNSRGISFFGCI